MFFCQCLPFILFVESSCLAIGYLYVGTEPHDLIDVGVNWPPSNSTCGVYAYI